MDHLWIPILCNYMKFCVKNVVIGQWINTPQNKMQYGSCCRVEFVSNSQFKHAVIETCHPSTKFCAISQSSTELKEHDGIQDGGHVR